MPLKKPKQVKRPVAWRRGYDAGLNPRKSATKDNPYRYRSGPDHETFPDREAFVAWCTSDANYRRYRENQNHTYWLNGFAAGRKKLRSLKREREKHTVQDQEYEIYANLGEEFSRATLAPE